MGRKIVTASKKSISEKEESVANVEKEKCFVIMPISDQEGYLKGHFTKVYEQIIKPAIEDAGYCAYRVDEDRICDQIIDKIFSAVQDVPMAVCDLSSRNPNVLYELGLRQAYNKSVVLIQDEKTPRIFDISGINTIPYRSTRLYEEVLEDREAITEAIVATKEGKRDTIVKIVKAKTADYSSINVTEDDKTQIMFNSILDSIQTMQDNVKRENKVNNESDNKIIRSISVISQLSKYVDMFLKLDEPSSRELRRIHTGLIQAYKMLLEGKASVSEKDIELVLRAVDIIKEIEEILGDNEKYESSYS